MAPKITQRSSDLLSKFMWTYTCISTYVHITVCINMVSKVPFSSEIWLLTPNCSFFFPKVLFLPNRFYSSLYLYKYLEFISFKTHSYSSIIYSSQTMIATLTDWASCPSWVGTGFHALELVPMSPSGNKWPYLGLYGLNCGGVSVGWVLTWLSVPHSMGFTVSDQLLC